MVVNTLPDATDKLNLDILDPANEAWKTAWKGKTSQAYRMLKRLHPTEKIIAVAIAGGPACDWERGELRNNFCQQYPDMVLKQIGDAEDYAAWLERTFPRDTSAVPEPVAEPMPEPVAEPAPAIPHPMVPKWTPAQLHTIQCVEKYTKKKWGDADVVNEAEGIISPR